MVSPGGLFDSYYSICNLGFVERLRGGHRQTRALCVRMLVKRAGKVHLLCHVGFRRTFLGLRAAAPSWCTILELRTVHLREIRASELQR